MAAIWIQRGNRSRCPGQIGFPTAQSSHLIGISDYTTPWVRERSLAIAVGCESVVLFALDQFVDRVRPSDEHRIAAGKIYGSAGGEAIR